MSYGGRRFNDYRNTREYGGKDRRDRYNELPNCDLTPIREVLGRHPIDVSKLKDDDRINKAVDCLKKRYADKRNRKGEEKLQELILQLIPTEKFFSTTPQERLDWAIILAFYLKSFDLKTNQVRKILDLAREINIEFKGDHFDEERLRSKLMRMRFILAYSVGKEDSRSASKSKKALETLYLVLDPLLLEVAESLEGKKFGQVYDFIQAVIAYHRFLGGSEK